MLVLRAADYDCTALSYGGLVLDDGRLGDSGSGLLHGVQVVEESFGMTDEKMFCRINCATSPSVHQVYDTPTELYAKPNTTCTGMPSDMISYLWCIQIVQLTNHARAEGRG